MADFIAGAVLTAAQLDTAFNTFTINAQTGTTYTLGAADAGEMVTINNNSGGTVTIPTNATTAFATGTHISILNAGTAGTFTVAGAGGVTFTSDVTTLAPRAAMTVVKTATNTWYGVSGSSGKASVSGTTGSPTVDTSSRPGKTIYKWTGSGSITISTAGTCEIFVLGGGGGGSSFGGGGGAGGLLETTEGFLPAGTHTVTIGGGGAAGLVAAIETRYGRNGSGSGVGPFIAPGGGTGGTNTVGFAGGCGGGGANGTNAGGAGLSTNIILGYAGGTGAATDKGGGGGGTGAVGGNPGANGGNGGNGKASTLPTGSSANYGGGGGGGSGSSGTGGTGGSGGGAAGSSGTTVGSSAAANTGGGGGGSYNANAGAGGSGYVVVVIG